MNTNLKNAKESLTSLCTNSDIKQLLKAIGESNELYIVGGAVRDCLMGKNLSDLDFASNLDPETLTNKLISANIRTIPTGLQHQTVTVVISEQTGNIEITTFRAEGMSPKGGLVHGKNIEQDLKFRDFTINSIAFNCKTHEFVDPYHGINDIDKKIISCTGSAKELSLIHISEPTRPY